MKGKILRFTCQKFDLKKNRKLKQKFCSKYFTLAENVGRYQIGMNEICIINVFELLLHIIIIYSNIKENIILYSVIFVEKNLTQF